MITLADHDAKAPGAAAQGISDMAQLRPLPARPVPDFLA